MLTLHKAMLIHPVLSDTHIFITYQLHDTAHFGLYFIWHTDKILSQGCAKGINQMQALSLAVKIALPAAFTLQPGHIFLWLQPKTLLPHLLMLQPHRDTHITYDTHLLIVAYLTDSDFNTLTLHTYNRSWPGAPSKVEHESPSISSSI